MHTYVSPAYNGTGQIEVPTSSIRRAVALHTQTPSGTTYVDGAVLHLDDGTTRAVSDHPDNVRHECPHMESDPEKTGLEIV